MKLTPLEIRRKEFSRSMRGYKDIEVDEFLDDIVDEFERLFNENIDFRERLEAMEEKVEQYRNIEETLKKTLVSAQQQAEELKHNAKKESDLILRDAELKARSILNDSYAERQKIQRSVQALKQKQEELRYQLRSVLESYMNILDQDGAVMTGELAEEGEAVFESPGEMTMVSSEAMPSIEEVAAGESEDAAEEEPAMTASEVALEDAAPADIRDDKPAARQTGDDDDPFADLEIDTEGREFKW